MTTSATSRASAEEEVYLTSTPLMPCWKSSTLEQGASNSETTTNSSPNTSPTCNGCHCLQTQAEGKCKKMDEVKSDGTTADAQRITDSGGQGKKSYQKAAKVKPEEVSTPTHFEHLVHIEDLQSNENNFVAPKVSQDPIIKSIFSVIEKNIEETGGLPNAASGPAESSNKFASSSLSYQSLRQKLSQVAKNSENASTTTTKFYVNGTEPYDNLNNLIIPTVGQQPKQVQQQQPSLNRNNLQLSLTSTTDSGRPPSIPSAIAPGFEDSGSNSLNSSIKLPNRKKLEAVPSTDSTDTLSPITPFTPEVAPIAAQFQKVELLKQEAAYDAIVARNRPPLTTVVSKKPMSPVYENYEVTSDIVTSKNDIFGDSHVRNDGFMDEASVEIQQALKQLDDVLDEQIPIEAFSALNLKSVHTAAKPQEGISDQKHDQAATATENTKKSVKELANLLSSKPFHFGVRSVPVKLHSVDDSEPEANQESNPETNAEAASGSGLEENPEVQQQPQQKPSLIGVSIFGPTSGKSIAEIIAEKRNRGTGLRPPPPTAAKPRLRTVKQVPESDTAGKGCGLSSQPTTSPEKPARLMVLRDENTSMPKPSMTEDENVKVTEEQNFEPPPPFAATGKAVVLPKPEVSTTAGTSTKSSGLNFYSVNRSTAQTDHIYENMYKSDGMLLETSFNGPIVNTTVQKRTADDGVTKSVEHLWIEEEKNEILEPPSTSKESEEKVIEDIPPLLDTEQKQQQNQRHPTNQEVPSVRNGVDTSVDASEQILNTGDVTRGVKWRTGYVAPAEFSDCVDDSELDPVPPPRTRSKRGSFGRLSGERPKFVQRSKSMYISDGNEFSSTGTENVSDEVTVENKEMVKRWSSMSTPEAEQIRLEKPRAPLVPPKPAPRRIDSLKRPTISNNKVADVSEVESRIAGKPIKRPIPLPRQSKLKVALNEDLLSKTSFPVTKSQHGAINGLESQITIAKATITTEGSDDGNEWILRL